MGKFPLSNLHPPLESPREAEEASTRPASERPGSGKTGSTRIPTRKRDTPLDELLAHRQIWQASTVTDRRTLGLDTGHDALNALLPDGGWPRSGVTELITDSRGIGELRLLMPALASLSQAENRWIAWIRSPHIPYAPALEACGIDTSKVLLIHPRNHKDALWAIEQALKTGTCAAVLAWPDPRQLKSQDIRRLQLAAKQGQTWGLMFRSEQSVRDASPAELRIQLRSPRDEQSACKRVEIKILKRRGGWPTEFFPLELDTGVTGTAPKTLAERLELWRKLRITNEAHESIYSQDDRIFFGRSPPTTSQVTSFRATARSLVGAASAAIGRSAFGERFQLLPSWISQEGSTPKVEKVEKL
ncbi:MAG: translesion DNA synthesis-associated protein ImuA [Pseudomonadales bacterium]